MQARALAALGVAGGYLLGRTRKLRLALTVGGIVAGRRLSSGGVLGKGLDVVTSSPEFARLRKQVGGAGRAAAVSAAGKSLRQVTERIEGGSGRPSDGDDAPSEANDDAPRQRPRKATGRSTAAKRSGERRPAERRATGRSTGGRSSADRGGGARSSTRAPERSGERRTSERRSSERASEGRGAGRRAPERRSQSSKPAAKKASARRTSSTSSGATAARRGGRRG
jgi:hypothetical protein